MLNSQFVQLVGNRLCIPVVIKEAVGNDKGLFLAHDRFQLVQGNRQTAFLDIYLLRGPEPEHIFSPLCNGFDIDKVLNTDILGNTVAAPGAAAKRQGGRKLEVIEIADAALRGRSIDQNTAGLHTLGKLSKLLFFRLCIEINRRGMTVAAVRNQMLCL